MHCSVIARICDNLVSDVQLHFSVNFLCRASNLQTWSVTTGRCIWKQELKNFQNAIITPTPVTEFWPHRRFEPLKEIENFESSPLYMDFLECKYLLL